MPFYETIFETGQNSIAFYEDDNEALRAAKAHHERAKKGEPGRGKSTPRNDLGDDVQQHVADYPAERIVELLKYDVHPADLMADQTLSSDVARKEVDAILKDKTGVVNLMELAAEIRELANPIIDKESRQESMYKMKEVDTLKLEDE